MRTRLRPLAIVSVVFAAQLAGSAAPPQRTASPELNAVVPAFVRNEGQADSAARFVSVGGGQPIFFTQHDVRIVDTRQRRSLWLMFVDGDPRAVEGDSPTGGRLTLLRRAASAESLAMYGDVVYRNVWPGIDVRISAAAAGVKYVFDIAPGADTRRIHLRYAGADRIMLGPTGELRLVTGSETIVDTSPVASQRITGRTVPVEVRFIQRDTDVTFAVGRYDRTRPLVIDPTLVYSTYLGSSGNDVGRAIAVDSTGAAYVAGSSNYFDLPVTPGAYQTSWHGDPNTVIPDAFVAKINPAGTHFDYVTYLGGFGRDEAFGLAIDAAGNAYITGSTVSTDFPTTSGAYSTAGAGFLAKLNSSGTNLVYSTLLGANSTIAPNSVAVDSNGNAYVAGGTFASNLPVSPGAIPFRPTLSQHGFLLKFNATGDAVTYGTYIGSGAGDNALSVAVTGDGTAYVAGVTSSFDDIAGGQTIQTTLNGPSYRSTDGGQTFASANTRTRASSSFAIDPTNPSTVYQGTLDTGVLKSTDGGAHWAIASTALGANVGIFDLAINPASPNILLATVLGGAITGGIWRTTDSGATWTALSQPGGYLAFAPSTPSVAYSSTGDGVLKSIDAGATWTRVFTAASLQQTFGLAIDPANSSVVYVGYSFNEILKTTNAGATWTTLSIQAGTSLQIVAVDPTSTNVVWAADSAGQLYRSNNGGVSWAHNQGVSLRGVSRMLFDGSTLYIAENDRPFDSLGVASFGLAKTSDGGATWSPLKIRGSSLAIRGLAVLNGLVYVGGDLHPDAFLWRVDTNAGEQAFRFGTYLGGGQTDIARSVAVDRTGNAVIAVETYSGDFPTTTAGPDSNTVVARVSADGTHLTVSSHAGDPTMTPAAVAIDASNNAFIAASDLGAARVDRIDPDGVNNATFTISVAHSNVGSPNVMPTAIAAGPLPGDMFMTGSTTATDLPTTPNAPQPFYGSGAGDAFIARIAFGEVTTPNNLALNKPVFVSSEFGPQFAGSLAVDGNPSTRWSSQFSDPQYIYVDLGQTYAISEVILRWETAFGADYQVQLSDDSTHWTTIRTITGGDGGVDDLTGLSGTGRFVRIYGTRRGTEWGYSLWEFEVYGTPAPPPDLARNKPVVTSSDFSTQYAGPFAVDGDPSTRWSSEFSDPQWIYVDLGTRYQINRVKLTWEAAYGADYQLQISNDAKNWVTIGTVQGNTLLTNDLGVGGIGRYVRMYGTRRGTEWGYSLWSFEVYGDPATDTTDVALNRPATSSSDFSSQYVAARAVDGDSSTRWSSEFSDPQWIAIDLGQVTVINEVRLTWETAFGADYEIQLSDDGINWFPVLTVTGGAGGVDDLVVGGTGRYVRMYGTRRGTEWGYSLWSFQVYGDPAVSP